MEKFNKIKDRGLRIAATVSSHHTGAFAAQAAYFFVLSLIPIFMLLLTMVQFTPVTKSGCDGGCTSGISIHSQPND